MALPFAFGLELPTGIQKIIEYNQSQAQFFAENVTFLIAFLGGILSFLLPCTIAILPAYFAYTFETKKELTKKTLLFFLGFSLVFVTLGIIAGLLNKGLDQLRVNYEFLIIAAGFILILLGAMIISGRGIPILSVNRKPNPSNFGIFVWGILLSIGWFACLGPILAGILLMAALVGGIFKSALLLFFYALGIFVPFFLVSVFYDKWNLGSSALIRGREFEFKFLGRKFSVHSSNLLSGILLIFLGLIFIFFKGTAILNSTVTYTTTFIYDAERNLANLPYVNIIGAAVLAAVVGLVVWSLRKEQ
ncbi:MAG TPA: cytochrome c biogenesis CcdA family protein [Candidatus Nanoarchaeia archaeon]|nr:cytochrome c biogenesis CcdA family protein [Candidatus Nanoarchaeia archaeon]